MEIQSFELVVTHGQIAVHNSHVERPFSFWTHAHAAQGFAWRPGSASFRTLCEGGKVVAKVLVSPVPVEPHKDTVRAVEVPFEVPSKASLSISTLTESRSVNVPPGRYSLRCEMTPGEGRVEDSITFLFIRNSDARFAIVRGDADARSDAVLSTIADPA